MSGFEVDVNEEDDVVAVTVVVKRVDGPFVVPASGGEVLLSEAGSRVLLSPNVDSEGCESVRPED